MMHPQNNVAHRMGAATGAGAGSGSKRANNPNLDRRRRYTRLDKIGEGAYGTVFTARDNITGKLVAMKQIKLHDSQEGVPSTTIREISVLKTLPHPNIIKIEEVIMTERKIILVFELVDQDLHCEIRNFRERKCLMPLARIQSHARQLLQGTDFCHRRSIIHRDIKPQNILIAKNGQLKVCDFGLARAFAVPLPVYTHEIVTLWYRAPEVLLGSKHYALGVDVWSIGCVLVEMATLSPLFPGDSEIDQIFNIFKRLGTPDEQSWKGVSKLPDYKRTFPRWTAKKLSDTVPKLDYLGPLGIDLISKMLVLDPKRRISCEKALRHPFFAHTFNSS